MSNGNGNGSKVQLFGVPVVALERRGNTALLMFVLGFVGYFGHQHLNQQSQVWNSIREVMKADLENSKRLLSTWEDLKREIAQRQELLQALSTEMREDEKELRSRLRALEIRAGVQPPVQE